MSTINLPDIITLRETKIPTPLRVGTLTYKGILQTIFDRNQLTVIEDCTQPDNIACKDCTAGRCGYSKWYKTNDWVTAPDGTRYRCDHFLFNEQSTTTFYNEELNNLLIYSLPPEWHEGCTSEHILSHMGPKLYRTLQTQQNLIVIIVEDEDPTDYFVFHEKDAKQYLNVDHYALMVELLDSFTQTEQEGVYADIYPDHTKQVRYADINNPIIDMLELNELKETLKHRLYPDPELLSETLTTDPATLIIKEVPFEGFLTRTYAQKVKDVRNDCFRALAEPCDGCYLRGTCKDVEHTSRDESLTDGLIRRYITRPIDNVKTLSYLNKERNILLNLFVPEDFAVNIPLLKGYLIPDHPLYKALTEKQNFVAFWTLNRGYADKLLLFHIVDKEKNIAKDLETGLMPNTLPAYLRIITTFINLADLTEQFIEVTEGEEEYFAYTIDEYMR